MDPTTSADPAGEEKLAATLQSKLIALLGISPEAEGGEVSEEQILARITELTSAQGSEGPSAGDLENLKAQLAAKEEELTGLHQQMNEAAIEEILKPFADRLSDEGARAAIRNVLLNDRASGLAILNALPPATAEKKKSPEENPPEPMHDPERKDEPDEAAKLKEAETLIASIRKERPAFSRYEEARAEARRRNPELFS